MGVQKLTLMVIGWSMIVESSDVENKTRYGAITDESTDNGM